jgi:two-component system response regulator YesN
MDYCTHARLNEAKHLLLTTRKSLDEIAERCGYASANYFSLIFKRKIGLSPLNYRKKK